MPARVDQGRRQHILYGDPSGGGGGHKAGIGKTGKTEFPPSWTDDEIITAIEHVANDIGSSRVVKSTGRTECENHYNGQDIKVIVENDGVSIVTGFPINVPKNP